MNFSTKTRSEVINGTLTGNLIIAARTLSEVRQKYLAEASRLRAKKVAKKDVEAFLVNRARAEGYFSADEELVRAKAHDVEWYHSIVLFVKWLKRNTDSRYNLLEQKKSRVPGSKRTVAVRRSLTENLAKKYVEDDNSLELIIAALKAAGYKVEKDT